MATTKLKSDDFVSRCLELTGDFFQLPVEHIWIDYDKDADVLYFSFRKPQHARKTIEVDDDILIRKDGNAIVGLTIMNAKER